MEISHFDKNGNYYGVLTATTEIRGNGAVWRNSDDSQRYWAFGNDNENPLHWLMRIGNDVTEGDSEEMNIDVAEAIIEVQLDAYLAL